MPMYAFQCAQCGNEFEMFLRPSEALRGVPCPNCGGHSPGLSGESAAAPAGPACDLSKKT